MKSENLAILASLAAIVVMTADPVLACTGFTASDDNKVLVGLNEDNISSKIYVEIIPPSDGKYGKIHFGYEGYGTQQRINDQGLLWDGFWAPHLDIYNGAGKPKPDSWLDEWLEVCSTVNEVIDIYNRYDWRDTGVEDGMCFFVDKYGNSAIIEGDEIIYKEGRYQAVANFYQSRPELGGYGFDRYNIAINMLENMVNHTMEYFRDICDATNQRNTIYSLVCDLTNNKINYYHHHNFNRVWEINLTEEFEFGEHTYDVLDVLSNHNPNKPFRPTGPTIGKVGEEYEFSCRTIDIDRDQVYYKWDWGDGNYSGWLGPYSSGENCTFSHKWSQEEAYNIRVMARDANSGKSDWSDPLPVSMPKIYGNPLWTLIEKLFDWLEHIFTREILPGILNF